MIPTPSFKTYVIWSVDAALSATVSILKLQTTMGRKGFGLFLRALNVVSSFEHTYTPRIPSPELKPGSYVVQVGRHKQIGLITSRGTSYALRPASWKTVAR